MTREREYVSFQALDQCWLLPSLREGSLIHLLSQDWVALIHELVPQPEYILSLPSIEAAEILNAWNKATEEAVARKKKEESCAE